MASSNDKKVALFGFETGNLGDDTQAIATSLCLPYVDRLVNRDKLARPGLREKHFIVAQSWFSNEWKRPPSPKLDMWFFGFCFGKPQMQDGAWLDYLRKHQPIDARDPGSMRRMAEHNVESHLTGCLTLRIGSFLKPVPAEERRGVILVDLSDKTLPLVPDAIRKNATTLTNYVPRDVLFDPLQRMVLAAQMNDKLRHAERVISNRLHIALPSVGYRTPAQVIVCGKESQRHRFSGFDEFIPVVYLSDNAELGSVDMTPPPAAVQIPEKLNQAYARFTAEIRERLGEVEYSQYENLYRKDRLTIPNPGLGSRPGRIGLDLGMRIVEREPAHWDEYTITFDLESYASFERSRIPVLAGHSRQIGRCRSVKWRGVGTVAEIMASRRR